MTTLLIMTLGQTDVQFVDQGKRCELEKDHVGALHDQLRSNLTSWEVVDAPAERGKAVTSFPANQQWQICTPKFDAVLAYLQEAPHSVLLLETTRGNASDPRFAGEVLEQRSKDKGIQDVRRCAFLGPGDRNLEDRERPLDAVIRREVVKRIEDAIRDAVKGATRVVVATTGGMPEVKALVRELARLHAPTGNEPDEVEVDDGTRHSGQADKAISRWHVDPIEPIRLRKQALSLIGNGNLIGAWGAVQHLDAQAHPWTLVIEWLYRFAASLPMPAECDIEVLKHPRMAVRAALRVELALRAGDIPRAVHGTVAFFESVLWDHLNDRFNRTWAKERGLEKLRLKSGNPAPAGKSLLRNDEHDSKEKRNCPFERLDDGTYLFYEDGAGRFARDYVKSEPLKKLLDAITKVRELRNDVAHNEPTPELMNEARTHMQTAALWSSTDTFLSQPLVQDVLTDLGEHEPANLLGDLLTEVRRRLLRAP